MIESFFEAIKALSNFGWPGVFVIWLLLDKGPMLYAKIGNKKGHSKKDVTPEMAALLDLLNQQLGLTKHAQDAAARGQANDSRLDDHLLESVGRIGQLELLKQEMSHLKGVTDEQGKQLKNVIEKLTAVAEAVIEIRTVVVGPKK